ncbi:nucleotide exchange factor GrpE [Bifidobacterium aerophilum]|uniref:Nucleotide exchange factor GrpE n=1 Tax=Bifidobacterium aerophilum TaxID=1798155 RepID=A0A6N9Z8E8_9BIFI|nr:nucleotide exchange factor GrpE [Bifidobacterium aerophilum]NEG90375.1 nucleotide exchange factor GrpE [Bifidobacterium aerophilum]
MTTSMSTPTTQPAGNAGVTTDDAARILAGLNQLTDLFRRRLLDDKAKAQAIDALSAAADAQRLAPLCREFALLLDRLAAYRGDDADARDFVASIGDEILAILAHYGFEPIASPKTFDPTTQRIVGVSGKPPKDVNGAAGVPDNTVVAVRRAGYRLGGTVIRPEEVIVYRSARTPAEADGKSEDAAGSAS